MDAASAPNDKFNPDNWVRLGGDNRFKCKYCDHTCTRSNALRHQRSTAHLDAVKRSKYPTITPSQPPRPRALTPEARLGELAAISAVEHIAHAFAHPSGSTYEHREPVQPPSPLPAGFNLDDDEPYAMAQTREEAMWDDIHSRAQAIEEIMGLSSDEDWGERPPSSDSSSKSDGEVSASTDDDALQTLQHVRKKRRLEDLFGTNKEWYPWPDRLTCALDIMMHLPRSVFSQKQMDLFLWTLNVAGVRSAPSVSSMGDFCRDVQALYGIQTIAYDGPLGHRYYVNDMSQIIAQELSNKRVRPKLHFLPEDAGPRLSEARQGRRWLYELPPELTTPTLKIKDELYYTFEPVLLTGDTVAIPVRWFTRNDHFFAQCWEMRVVGDNQGRKFWRAYSSPLREVSTDDILKSFPKLDKDMRENRAKYNFLPPVSNIREIYDHVAGKVRPWDYTTAAGNRWRYTAGVGVPVYSFPIWLYCDDTSGNLSKKWNCHNSWLFTPAGLPRSEAAKEYNVHFLCTSNLAPPLEMADGIVDQIEKAQKDGIWAWDCVDQQPVVVFPVILALLGDNPMQSELAAHIGLRGRKFCRVCEVERAPALQPDDDDEEDDVSDGGGDLDEDDEFEPDEDLPGDLLAQLGHGNAAASSSVPVDTPFAAEGIQGNSSSSASALEPKSTEGQSLRSRVAAGIRSLRKHLDNFIRPGVPRQLETTKRQLGTYFEESMQVGTQTRMKAARTKTGVKDTFQMYFINMLHDSYKTRRKKETQEKALADKLRTMPRLRFEDTTNPLLRLPGLNPHSDTPVEILHVVLLGFIKYFWKDVIKKQLNDKPAKKEELATRLNSVSVSGLGLSPLPGKTMVQHSGSLVGRDFRAIAQVAPFVLHGMVKPECYATWISLSRLVPLIWKPEIEDISSHVRLLEDEIHQFLLNTARWSSAWFSKPKFHILVHLPQHIARFGPAILFATEAFESFNAVIRAKSVHSNRQAPSRDIALSFAQGNRLRHWLGGGAIRNLTSDSVVVHNKTRTLRRAAFSKDKDDWSTVGPGPQLITKPPAVVSSYLGLGRSGSTTPKCVRGKLPVPFSALQLSHEKKDTAQADDLFWSCTRCGLGGGDKCYVGSFVVAHRSTGEKFIGRVKEMVMPVTSTSSQPETLVVQEYTVENPVGGNIYNMPALVAVKPVSVICCAYEDVLCTVNAQHTCAELKCTSSGKQTVVEERVQTSKTRSTIEHQDPKDSFVLNTAQMRDASEVQRHRLPLARLEPDIVLDRSAEALFGARVLKKRQRDAVRNLAVGEKATLTNVTTTS